MARITTPVEDFTGDGPGGLHFVNGVAETDDAAVIGYCQGAGYGVELDTPAETTDTGKSGRPAAGKGATGAQD